jgi:hypothetical protein
MNPESELANSTQQSAFSPNRDQRVAQRGKPRICTARVAQPPGPPNMRCCCAFWGGGALGCGKAGRRHAGLLLVCFSIIQF